MQKYTRSGKKEDIFYIKLYNYKLLEDGSFVWLVVILAKNEAPSRGQFSYLHNEATSAHFKKVQGLAALESQDNINISCLETFYAVSKYSIKQMMFISVIKSLFHVNNRRDRSFILYSKLNADDVNEEKKFSMKLL